MIIENQQEQEARDLLAALGFDPEHVGELELRLIGGPEGPMALWKFDWTELVTANENGANIYFGACHRDGRGGKLANITYATALWADIDGKDWNSVDPAAGKETALAQLNEHIFSVIPPSVVVDSGHGFHVYWLLKQPWAFSSDEQRGTFTAALTRLATATRGDRRVKDVTRVLRLPGTWNTKSLPRVQCRTTHWDIEKKYDLEELVSAIPVIQGERQVIQGEKKQTDFSRDLDIVIQALPRLAAWRVDDYEAWIQIGMVLHSISDDPDESTVLLSLWDNWSRASKKYSGGLCAEKWLSFSVDRPNGLTLDSLIKWANEDSGQRIVLPGGRNPKPSQILRALVDMGYSFKQNEMNDVVYVNSIEMSDGLRARVLVRLNENKYRNNAMAELTWTAAAYDQKFHPIRDYLDNLNWDGNDWIGKLGEAVLDEDRFFPALLKAWLVGAVGKILGPRPGQHHPMLVLDGPQGIGKSRLVWWLGSSLPQFFIASPVNPDDKDFLARQCSSFVWEVEELGSTFRRSDREALKAFMSREFVIVRKPYGRYDIHKPVTASYIGTINNEGGFLTDPTGNRRFRIATLTAIDWSYSTEIPADQVWAQAVELFKNGATWELPKEVEDRITAKNTDYLAEDPVETILWELYEATHRNEDRVRMADILSDIQAYNVRLDINMSTAARIGAILTRAGLKRRRYTIDGKEGIPMWVGLRRSSTLLNPSTSIDVNQLLKADAG